MHDAETVTSATGPRPAFEASRAQLGLILVLLAMAVGGWVLTVRLMKGMDSGPWTGLGSLGWFLGVWVVMMAAMMFPSVAPTVALYGRMNTKSPAGPAVFTSGYLLTWTAAGVLAFTTSVVARQLAGDHFAWDRAGRPLAAATLIAAAVYELTPLKNACLGKCRSPLGALLGSWREGTYGALRMGMKNGAWCVGCCWALMAALFALGVMSVTWMAVLAVIIAGEKLLPWRRTATYVTASILLGLGLLVLLAPQALPGLTIPTHRTAPAMPSMG